MLGYLNPCSFSYLLLVLVQNRHARIFAALIFNIYSSQLIWCKGPFTVFIHIWKWKEILIAQFPLYVTNNFNQANNLMLWWTLEHRAITICWGGLFYNWGEDSNSTHPNYFPSISRGEMFELPPWNCMMTVKWRPRWWRLCVIEFLLQNRPALSHGPQAVSLSNFHI